MIKKILFFRKLERGIGTPEEDETKDSKSIYFTVLSNKIFRSKAYKTIFYEEIERVPFGQKHPEKYRNVFTSFGHPRGSAWQPGPDKGGLFCQKMLS